MRKTNYPVGDFLVSLKNAAQAGQKVVELDGAKFLKSVALALKEAGYLDSVEVEDGKLKSSLAYRKKEPLLMDIKLVSKPGLRIYMGADDLAEKKGPFSFIVSTSKGVMMSDDAVKKRLGGEVLAKVL